MRKLLVLLGGLALLAAACDAAPTAYYPPRHVQTTASTKVDAMVSNLTATVDSEEAVSTKSDDDLVNSDKAVINSYDGVSNASSY